MKRLKISIPIFTLALALSCGGLNFASQLRVILASAGPLIESLNLGPKRVAVVTDFTDLGNGAATLADAIKACTDKPCKLNAVGAFESTFETVSARGNLGSVPKLQRIQSIIRGIISAARIYYGGAVATAASNAGTEADIKARLAELKREMQP